MTQPASFATLPPPTRLLVPLSSRAPGEDNPAKPPGTKVERGEALADAVAATGHVPLAPASGRIISITRADLLNGRRVAAVELEVDPADDATDRSGTPVPFDALPLPAWIDRLRAAGVWAERRASPDLLGQLNHVMRRPCDTVICHALDDASGAAANARIASANPLEMVTGVAALTHMTGVGRVIIVLPDDAPAGLQSAVRGATKGSGIRVQTVPSAYPQADPTVLLYTTLGRRLRPGRLPTEQGVVQVDAPAAIAVGQVSLAGEPMLDVPLVVRDVNRRQTHVLRVPVGTVLRHVLRHLDIPEETTLRASDALRDIRVPADAVVSGGELVIHVGYAEPPAPPDPCVRCGWCVQACPTRIHPAGLLEAAQRNDDGMADRFGIDSCIECGICSYVCPSRLPLLGAIRTLRGRR